jgi:hypothetical protein
MEAKSRMSKYLRFTYDRRCGIDRRKAYTLDYFLKGEEERRRRKDRRLADERRTDWVRVTDWVSVWREFIDPEHSLPR